jgi:hypothetical protein
MKVREEEGEQGEDVEGEGNKWWGWIYRWLGEGERERNVEGWR